jgi:hypothetical protein
MKVSLISLMGVVVLLAFGGSFATSPVSAGSPKIPVFRDLDDKAASDAADALVENYHTTEKELTSQMDSGKTSASRKLLLIYVLGEMRSSWAVPSLVGIVDFPAPFLKGLPSDISPWGHYPAVDALTSIGNPSVTRIIDVLSTETNPLRMQLMFTVIYQVEGNKRGRIDIEDALATTKDDSAKRNLQNALTAYNSLMSQFERAGNGEPKVLPQKTGQPWP